MKKYIAVLAAFSLIIGTCGTSAASTDADIPETLPLGDINGDGLIDGRDATAVLTEYTVVSTDGESTFTDAQYTAADVNTDLNVDARDATAILTFYARQSTGLDMPFWKYMGGIKAENVMENMTLHEKICQMFIVRPEALAGESDTTTATAAMKNALTEYPVGGLIYFSRNLISPMQAMNMIGTTKQYAAEAGAVPLFYGIDEEGGAVARCAEVLGTTAFQPMYSYKDMGTETAYANAKRIAADISLFGFDLDFAPVADTWSNYNNTVIGTRAYSDDFAETAELVEAAVRGFSDGGVFCTLKHFPGHGNTAEDSHYSSAVSYRTAEQLKNNEYLAFESGISAGADLIMIGHITVPDIDTLPASLSQKIVEGQLRGVLGYDGVIISDALNMGAVANSYRSSVAAVMAVEAGCDILLAPASLTEAAAGLEAAVKSGSLTEERIDQSVKRILTLKTKHLIIG